MSLEPLADYLEPQFGNIYKYNLPVSGNGFEIQEWTDELRQAVTRYLAHEASADDYAAFLDELAYRVPVGTSREAQAKAIVDAVEQPWEVAHAFHMAAIKAVPTLEELIGDLETWPDAGLQDDVGEWLDAHASRDQISELAEVASHLELTHQHPRIGWREGWHFTWKLTPLQLLQVWYHVAGPGGSDLTEDDWQLLLPLVQERPARHGSRTRSEHELLRLRRAFDGIRYKFARDVPWSQVPPRYGARQNVYQRYVNYRDRGDFARMYEQLEGRPGAERVKTWLKVVAGR